ncbi:MAG: endopeptidase La [Clostridiales bacterium]|nr:endopeptidase La [Candidatus Apopatousia equi]
MAKEYKVIAIMGVVSFPEMPINCEVRKQESKDSIMEAFERKEDIVLVTQIANVITDDFLACVNGVGTVCKIKDVSYDKRGSGNLKIVAEGVKRVALTEVVKDRKHLTVLTSEVNSPLCDKKEVELLLSSLKEKIVDFCNTATNIKAEVIRVLNSIDDANSFVDYASLILLKDENKQLALLNEFDIIARLEKLSAFIDEEIEIVKLNQRLSEKVRQNMDKSQKEYYLREQMKAISDELGENESIFDDYAKKIEKMDMPKEVKEKANKELSRLRKLPNASPDYSILQNYLETVLELPWGVYTKDNKDLDKARKILDEDHSGLDKVKDRIIENLAVMHLTEKISGQIICFVGPPGVGKTSIVRSIARALDRNFVKMSVGGVKDESEIRGHRKTYVGAMPGRIIYNMSMAKSMNPVFLIDEIDKMASDYRGDPTSALLEVLDPEQNYIFRDHFLEVPFDLSNVLFIATANNIQDIPAPLLDRMEIIELSSYTTSEKFKIAKEHLIPKEVEKNGLKLEQIKFEDSAITDIIEQYTYEAGVRSLERQIATICRKVAVKIVKNDNKEQTYVVDTKSLSEYLGNHKIQKDEKRKEAEVGVVSGLSYSTVGGGVLSIEVNKVLGDGKVILTGRLGDVMQESAKAALSAVIGIANEYNIDPKIFRESDIHIHVPEGAVKKDGPSAGSALATAIFSAFSGKKIDNNLAMTGEITIRGNVLAIGGLKEKLFACVRAGITKVIVPEQNKDDILELPKEITDNLNIVYVNNLREVLKEALVD